MAALIYLNPGKKSIERIDLKTKAVTTVFDQMNDTPDGIVINPEGTHMYWTNMGADWSENDGYLEQSKVDGSERKVLIPQGHVVTPKQLIADWANKKLYWCDREGMRVFRANLDGTGIEVLVQRGTSKADSADENTHCVGIAVDPVAKQVYWTQKGPPKGGTGCIYRAPYDLPQGKTPANRDDIETLWTNLPEPIDLYLDVQSQVLYWTDRGKEPQGNTLNRAFVPRLGQKGGEIQILDGGYKEAIGLDFSPKTNHLYVTDLAGNIRQFDKGSYQSSLVANVGGYLTGIAVLE